MTISRYPPTPKRWESAESTVYDPIRGKPWFRRLLKRKRQIPALREASKLVSQGQPQWKAAAEFGVDERELRDYRNYIIGSCNPISRVEQDILDHAYDQYQFDGARLAFHAYVMSSAKMLGLNPRAIRELWEIHPFFLPTVYQNEAIRHSVNADRHSGDGHRMGGENDKGGLGV